MSDLTREGWRRLLDQLDGPAVGQVAEALADARDLAIGDAYDRVEEAIDAGDLLEDTEASAFGVVRVPEERENAESGEESVEEPVSDGSTPTLEAVETGERDGESETIDVEAVEEAKREEAVDALRDVLRFYNTKVDEVIGDHTEDGEHPERPTTAREYFTERRGWDSDTVDDLLLGWAPADHADELVAFLHDRGHSREAMIATGAIGVSDGGSFYTTFSARYVLPYYDARGEPTYAIARCTGGIGGGAKGYGGHPRDYQAGKYAKLRHTDLRVPFDEPIYGLDTLEDGKHVVVAEGIADAITAREEGYAVLSPVAKEFKEDHYDPLVDALDDHKVERVTIVADNDHIRRDDAEEAEPESIGGAIDASVQPIGPGLAGALRTATKLNDRIQPEGDQDDEESGPAIRVALPPAPGDLESDLDEFVTGDWEGDLPALLRSAKPAEEYEELETAVSAAERSRRRGGSGDYGDGDTPDPVEEAPAEMPACYASALAARKKPSEYGYATDHDLNRVVALLGVYAGYSNDELVDHFADNPLHGDKGEFDGHITRKAIKGTRRKIDNGDLAPPSESTLKEKGILDEEGCNCPIHSPDDVEEADTEGGEEYKRDPRRVDVVLDAKRAWNAAALVAPDQLDEAIGLDVTDDGDAWRCPVTDARVDDVARAVAIAEERVADAEKPLTEEYAPSYQRARDAYGAPLPEYLTHADTIARFDAVLGAVRELDFFHLDRDALTAEITGEGLEVSGEARLTLDPTPVDGWRDSESGESVLVFPSGTVYDVDLGDGGQVIDALRFVAVDAGLIDDPTRTLEGDLFTEAYRLAREEYGAPLPRWTSGAPDVTPVLPPAEDLVEAPEVEDDELTDLRNDVEALYRSLASGDGGADVSVLNVLPALGKTTAAVKTAAERPTTYLAPRKELMKQAEEKADKWGATAAHLPIFAEANLNREALGEAVEYVRENGTDTLQDREAILDAIDAELWDAEDDEDGDDEVDLDRPTCPTAEGDHGDAWAIAVHVARELDYTPRDIHQRARTLFGEPLPCQNVGDCEYSDGWDAVADPDAPIDLLIGHYVHSHVESARTHYTRDGDGVTEREPRAVVLDEFVGDVFAEEFGPEAKEHAVWLARTLHDDVEDRHDLASLDLWGDEFVRQWLAGEAADDGAIADLDRGLEAEEAALRAAGAARELLEYDIPEEYGLDEILRRAAGVPQEADDRATLADQIASAAVGVDEDDPAYWIAEWADEDVAEPLARSADLTPEGDEGILTLAREALPDGDLIAAVEKAVSCAAKGESWATGVVTAARDAIAGGDDGARELSVFADDGYAHRDANYLLEAMIRPGESGASRISTENYFAGESDGSNVKHVTIDGVTVVYDRNDRGAEIHAPPEWTAGDGEDCPVIGLDATARKRLWEVALGDRVDVALRDVHDTPRERARCLREVHKLQIVQTSDLMKSYEGDPSGKNLDADVALLEEIQAKYAGVHAPRDRGEDAVDVGNPATITTKCVREVLEADERLDGVVSEWENYGNLTGDNTLGGHQLAALLGSQHYGDREVERFAALAGEEVTRAGYGADLDYGSDVANEFLGLMREDQVMQAALRFTRGGSGALVFAHTAALRDDLPVVGEGEVIRSWSPTASAIAEEWRRTPGAEFTAADVADAVDVSRRQVRRVLGEFVEAGYLERHDTGDGLANEYAGVDTPGAGEVDLDGPERAPVGGDPGQDSLDVYYTANVRVRGVNSGDLPRSSPIGSALPAPDTADPGGKGRGTTS